MKDFQERSAKDNEAGTMISRKQDIGNGPQPGRLGARSYSTRSTICFRLISIMAYSGCFVSLPCVISDSFRGYEHRSAFVLNKEHDHFCRFGLAGVSPDDVNILGALIEGLTRCQSDLFPAPHLHYD